MSPAVVHIVEENVSFAGEKDPASKTLCGAPLEGLFVRNTAHPRRSHKYLCPACVKAAEEDRPEDE